MRGPRVLGAQPKDLHAYLSHAGAVLVAHEPIHEEQVDEVTVAIVRAFGVDERVGRPIDLLAGGSFGGRDLELHCAPRIVLVADLDIAAESGGVANLLEPGQPDGKSLPAVSQRGAQPRGDLLACQPRGGVEILRRARPESE